MTDKTVVISDIHSRQGKLETILTDLGVLHKGARQPGFKLVQVGDAVSAGYGMKEAEFYRWWVSILTDDDVELLGNHEAPIILPYGDRLEFYGYRAGDGGTDGCDPELKVEVLARQNKYRIAHAVGDWLITHAGVRSRYSRGLTAQETADKLNGLWDNEHVNWKQHSSHSCPICCPYSGCLWVRDLEKHAINKARVKQIFGHTPDGPTLGRKGTIWNIDTPRLCKDMSRKEAEAWGGVAALVTADDGENWKLHYVE